jgi:8-oxo-dGTP pyrophosphatase MutT (NUDIX family)
MEAAARPAATILLLREGVEALEVFMVVRHHDIDFAGGALVFPGGRVEEADRELAERVEDCPNPGALDTDALAFRVAAIRETFEECGVLLARPVGSDALIDAATLRRLEDQHRGALNAGSIGFDAVLGSEVLLPATDLLVHFAHWITPASMSKRYDTHFFLAEAPAAHLAVHDGREAVRSVWITPARALAAAAAGEYKLVFATAKNLEKLGRSGTVREAMAAARRAGVVTVQPTGTKLESGKRLMRIPAEADYGGTEFIVDYQPAASS